MIKKIVFFDHNWDHIFQIIKDFTLYSRKHNLNIIILSDRKQTAVEKNIRIQNIFEINQSSTLEEMQKNLPFSIHKRLSVERAFYDYSSFRKTQCYSRMSSSQIEKTITPYINALDYTIKHHCDLVIDWFPDNFLSSIASILAKEYKKKFAAFFPHYWWGDGALVVDRPDMTSSLIEKRYKEIYCCKPKKNIKNIDTRYKNKKSLFYFSATQTYSIRDRINLFVNRQYGYQPISLSHLFIRRASTSISSFLIENFVKFKKDINIKDSFVLYPLHISPEASILGTIPELADQFSLIKNISLNLPFGIKLYVKQHPFEHVGLGHDYGFYRRLSSLPNVVLVHKKIKIEDLFNHSKFLALTILAGTAALDAVIKRKPVFVFGKTYFSFAHCFIKPTNFGDFFKKLQKIIEKKYTFNADSLKALLLAIDKSVIRANVDFVNQKNTKNLSSQLPKIWVEYIKTLNKTAK